MKNSTDELTAMQSGDIKEKRIRALITIAVFALGIMYFYYVRNNMIGEDAFRKDVFNTYIESIFTSRRGFPAAYVLLISILGYSVVLLTDIGKISRKMVLRAFFAVGNVIMSLYLILIGALYASRFAYVNIQQGEYLTGFERFMLVPYVGTAVLWVIILWTLVNSRKGVK